MGKLQEYSKNSFYPTGKDEMNLAEFPFATLNPKDSRDVMEYIGWTTTKEGEREQQKWVARGAGGLGLPSEFGERLLMALITLTSEQHFASRKVSFSIYQLLNMLGLARNKRYYELIEKQLEKLVGMTIYSEGAFWNEAQHKRITTKKAFHLIDHLWLAYLENDEQVKERENVPAYIVWSEQMWGSFRAGYLKTLDLKFYYGLQTPLSRRLYRFLDKRMRYQDQYEIDIFELANRLGMANYQMPSRLKRKLQPAFEKLIEAQFLVKFEFIKVKKYTRARFYKFTEASQDDNSLALAEDNIIDGTMLNDENIDSGPQVSPINQQWQQVLDQLKLQMPKSTFETWLKDTTLLDLKDDIIIIGVKNTHAQEWLENRLSHLILRSACKVWAKPNLKVTFEIPQ